MAFPPYGLRKSKKNRWSLNCFAMTDMELTWVAIAASICMGLAAACVFIFAVQKDYFHNIEDAKYQVFWQDMEDLVQSASEKQQQIKEQRDHEDTGQ